MRPPVPGVRPVALAEVRHSLPLGCTPRRYLPLHRLPPSIVTAETTVLVDRPRKKLPMPLAVRGRVLGAISPSLTAEFAARQSTRHHVSNGSATPPTTVLRQSFALSATSGESAGAGAPTARRRVQLRVTSEESRTLGPMAQAKPVARTGGIFESRTRKNGRTFGGVRLLSRMARFAGAPPPAGTAVRRRVGERGLRGHVNLDLGAGAQATPDPQDGADSLGPFPHAR